MNNLDHFQSVASLTRSLFEMWLDLKILAKDQTGKDVRKYNEFPEIERYRAAEQLVNANPQVCATTTKISNLDYFSGWMTSIKVKTREFIVTEQIELLEAKRKQATR